MNSFAETCEAVAATSSKNEKVAIVADYLRSRPMPDAELAAVYFSGRFFPSYDERTLQVGGALLWRALAEAANTNEAKVALIYRKHGDLGAAAAEMLSSRKLPGQPLTLTMAAESFRRIAQARGPAAKHALLRDLLARASSLEAKYLIKIMTGELRIGLRKALWKRLLPPLGPLPLKRSGGPICCWAICRKPCASPLKVAPGKRKCDYSIPSASCWLHPPRARWKPLSSFPT